METTLDTLITLFAKLPGIGKKSAGRLAYHILETNRNYAQALGDTLHCLHDSVKQCSVCGCWTESDPCDICCDTSRDRSMLCVVEKAQDVRVIEESREFPGRFHVLGGLIAPLDGINPDDLAIGTLLKRVREEKISEVILALNPTVEGDTTALYIQRQLQETGTSVSRLASGLPAGGELEYTDRLTLARSLRGRIVMR
ncbi:recombination protein RecR [Spirochaetia bacterium]|nr:recombination protein RecR [Spirochaetia bacterium]